MNVTHQNVIDYIVETEHGHYYKVLNGKLILSDWIEFNDFKFSTLPGNMVFKSHCDLDNSAVTSIPDDIVMQRGLYIQNTKIKTIPVMSIYGELDIRKTEVVLQDGIFISGELWSDDTVYHCLDSVKIDGYYIKGNILS